MSPKHDKRDATYHQLEAGTKQARPIQHQHAAEIQPYGKIAKLPIALDEKTCATSTENLNQLLADTMTLRDMYKKHHWQVAASRTSWWIESPSGFSSWAASALQWRQTWPRQR